MLSIDTLMGIIRTEALEMGESETDVGVLCQGAYERGRRDERAEAAESAEPDGWVLACLGIGPDLRFSVPVVEYATHQEAFAAAKELNREGGRLGRNPFHPYPKSVYPVAQHPTPAVDGEPTEAIPEGTDAS